MRKMKKFLASLLAVSMLVGSVPASAMPVKAAEAQPVDAAIIFSDLHTSSSNYKESTVKGIFTALKNTGLPFSSVTSAGDAFSVNEDSTKYTGKTSTITGYIKNVMGNIPVNYVWSDHDRYALKEDNQTLLSNESGLIYGAGADGDYGTADDDNYYIYSLSMADLSTNNRYNADFHTDAEVTAAIADFTESASNLKKDRPLFIASHQPLLARRGDNGHAAKWCSAINSIAENMDVAFFFGHNHKYDVASDYYYGKGSDMPVAQSNNDKTGTNTRINFTHMCAGYMEPTSTGSYSTTGTRRNVAMAITIYDDSIRYTTYNKNGIYTGSYAVDESITRDHKSVADPMEGYTLSSIAISGVSKTKYFVNDELDLSKAKVTATYTKEGSDNKTKEITEGYTLSGYNKENVGEQTVTVSYTENNVTKTTTFDVEVFKKVIVNNETNVSVEVETPGATVVNASVNTSDTVASAVASMINNIKAYDITVTGHNKGEKVTVTLPIPENVTTPEVYYVSNDGKTVTNMNAVKSDDGKTVSFETDHFSTYVIGQTVVPEDKDNEVTEGGTTYEEKTVYVRVDSFENNENYLLVGEDNVSNGNPIALVNENGADRYASVSVNTNPITVGNVTYSNGYIELNNSNAVFSATGSADTGYTLKNGNHYIGGTGATTLYKSQNDAVAVKYDNSAVRLKTAKGTTRYLYYSTYQSETWKWSESINSSTSSRAMYIYKEVTARIPTSSQVKYTMQASNVNYVIGSETPAKIDYALLANGEKAETLPAGGSYSFTPIVGEGETSLIDSISDDDGTITFKDSTRVGSQYVKVAYTWKVNGETKTVYKYIVVSVAEPHYELELHFAKTVTDDAGNVVSYEKGNQILAPIVIKNVKDGDNYKNIWAVISLNGEDVGQLSEEQLEKLTFTSSDESIATVDSKTGIVTLTGKSGKATITATFEYADGKSVTDEVVFSVSDESYYTPEDGTENFPQYPNEGSVRFDKTAKAVGNFSETGIAQLELSMTGVPYTEGNRLDVVLMLDRSSSMYKDNVKHRIPSTVEATKTFIENIVKNEDGTFNNNRILVLDFLGGNLDSGEGGGSSHQYQSNRYTELEDGGYQVIETQAELDTLLTNIQKKFTGQTSLYGTEYARGLEDCYNALQNSRTDGNKQFCVFMSDGIPNYLKGETTHFKKTKDIITMFDIDDAGSNNANVERHESKYEYEYYSTKMKNEGVTVFTVGLGLHNKNSAWSAGSATACENVANILLNDISGPAGETTRDTGKTISKLGSYFFSVADANAAADMKDVFQGIAEKIHEAARDVKVTDKIADEYTMVFDFPNATVANKLGGQEFYIEVKDYPLTPVYGTGDDANTIVDYKRNTEKATSLEKLYIGSNKNSSGTVTSYYAASDKNGTAYAAPIFEAKPVGTKYYWTTDSTKGDSGVSVVSGNTTYYFASKGNGTHNITSGAYAYGTPTVTDIISDETTESIGKNTTCQNMIIATKHFVYNAATRMLVWTTEKLTKSELAISYFLYLDQSGGYVGNVGETPADTYPTNDYANLNYTNFNGVECEQKFPIPQLTWNGAQVSYVFYLVNEAGYPVNKAGRRVPFSEAVYVTDVHTYSVQWNANDAEGKLEARYLASELVPDVYELYDDDAFYNINVYEDEIGTNRNNNFVISGDVTDEYNTAANKSWTNAKTTYVYNTKADAEKYNAVDTYKASDVHTGFDFSNTTVAFAVVWKPELKEDAVVIDYGLPVDINVSANDGGEGSVTGICGTNMDWQGVLINKGQIVNNMAYATKLVPDQFSGLKSGEAELINNSSIRFTPTSMQMSEKEMFYYVTTLDYYQNDVLMTSRMYSSVTVIPATTIYYEDEFVDFTSFTKTTTTDENGKTTTSYVEDANSQWIDEGTKENKTQAQDRPGASKISETLDADNNYGYDAAYENSSQFSLGSSKKIEVTADNRGEATFSFYGTGFDIVGLTSNKTGTLLVQVKNEAGKTVKSSVVDTYYGYAYVDGEWKIVDSNSPNALFQVPVMKISGLTHGKYTAKLIAGYNSGFDHTGDNKYSLYIDAIRIYDPAAQDANGEITDSTIKNAYDADGEAYPEYIELRDKILTNEEYNNIGDTDVAEGIVFIDGKGTTNSVADYISYGPNNELYLQSEQAVAFDLNASAKAGKDLATVQLAIKSVGGAGKVEVYGIDSTGTTTCLNKTISTATDLYYDITKLNGKTVVIKNSGTATNATISITNIKTTYKTAEEATETTGYSLLSVKRPSVDAALLSLCEDAEITSVRTNKSSYTVKDTVKATITTNDATEYITVNGEKITEFSEETGVRSWTYSVKTTKTGSVKLKVVAYNEMNEATEEVVKTVSVKKFAPKTFELLLNKKKVIVGEKVKATVTTSTDVKYVTINGKKITKYTSNKAKGTRTWTLEVKATKSGKMTFKAVAYNTNASASNSISATTTAQKFAPKTFNLSLSKKTVKKGQKYTVTVKTSSDVKYVTINGNKVTKYTSNSSKTTRTFKVTYTAKTIGKKTIKAVAYNKNSSASNAKTTTVTVKK